MEITDIVIRKLSLDSKMKAIVSITFDQSFVVHDVKVVEGNNGLFIAMPSRRTPEGEFKDIVHPINSEFREVISSQVLARSTKKPSSTFPSRWQISLRQKTPDLSCAAV